jgi:tRNA A37 threonylcarbamoyladenosine modification protein TsaB
MKNLLGIVVVNGPGSFTAMRIITLTINTLSFVHHIPLYSIDYFTQGTLSSWTHPIILRANRGEYLIEWEAKTPPAIVAIQDILDGSYF